MHFATPLSDQLLADILDDARPLLGKGKVADYIPALAEVSPNYLAMAVLTNDGKLYSAGDVDVPFSIQSISKVLALTVAMDIYGDELWDFVRREPSGMAFNSLVQLEMEAGVPRNPFINVGAVRVCDLLDQRLAVPEFRIVQLIRQMTGNDLIHSNRKVAQSEFKLSDRNAAMAHLMKSFGRFSGDVTTVLKQYFHNCALEMSCVDMTRCFSYLANRGKSVETGEQIISDRQSKQINALLLTCGLYDEAGDFAYRVGIPGKSGVGGGIVGVIPGELTVAVWSPELNEQGNSLAGVAVLEEFTSRIGRSIF